VAVRTTTDRVDPGEEVTVEASVADETYMGVNDATVIAQVARPGGATIDVPLQWTGERDGQYRGSFATRERGPYEVRVDATRASKPAGSGLAFVRAAAGEVEYFEPAMQEAPLRRIAEETGGRFYTPESLSGLAEDVRLSGRGVTSVEERPLWNMPILLITLIGLVCVEWGYRRAVGLA
jgi:hypothetical protein